MPGAGRFACKDGPQSERGRCGGGRDRERGRLTGRQQNGGNGGRRGSGERASSGGWRRGEGPSSEGWRSGGGGPAHATMADGAAAIVQEAELLRHQARKKRQGQKDLDKIAPLLERSLELYKSAVSQQGISVDQRVEWLFDYGETLMDASAEVMRSEAGTRGSPFSGNVTQEEAHAKEKAAKYRAAQLCRKSFDAFECVISFSSCDSFRQEALVNSGNALSACAGYLSEIQRPDVIEDEVAELFEKSLQRYSMAIEGDGNDTDALINFADTAVKYAEVRGEHVSTARGTGAVETDARVAGWEVKIKEVSQQAIGAYERAYSLTDPRSRDDLSGLLQNWGCGLSSVAKLAAHLKWEEGSLAQGERAPDSGFVETLFFQAEEKLRNAASLACTDIEPFADLAEVLTSRADRAIAFGQSDLGLGLLNRAIEEGYVKVLGIDSTNLDAQFGIADVHMSAGNLQAARGDRGSAVWHWGQSAAFYGEALALVRRAHMGTAAVVEMPSFRDQCHALYNYGCAACLSGKLSIVEEVLKILAKAGSILPSDLAEDADWKAARESEWFPSFLEWMAANCPATGQAASAKAVA